jgi:hypothetical protein
MKELFSIIDILSIGILKRTVYKALSSTTCIHVSALKGGAHKSRVPAPTQSFWCSCISPTELHKYLQNRSKTHGREKVGQYGLRG